MKFLSNLLRRRMKKGKQSTVMGKLPFLKEVVVRTRIRLCYTCKRSQIFLIMTAFPLIARGMVEVSKFIIIVGVPMVKTAMATLITGGYLLHLVMYLLLVLQMG